MAAFVFTYASLNILLGTLLYFLLHKEVKETDILGFSCVYSIVVTPCILYFLRVLNFDNGINFFVILGSLLVLCVHKWIRKKLIFLKADAIFLDDKAMLLIVCVICLLFVNEGLLTGAAYRNDIGDMAKSYGTIIATAGSKGLYIEHPFAVGNRMYYYFFYYFKAAEIIKILGGTCTFKVLTWIIFLDGIMISFSVIFLLHKIGTFFGLNQKYITFISAILIADGGFDCLWMIFENKNEIGGGYIDGWVRVVYEGLAVTAHSNYFIKLLWQPQHVSAVIPFLLFLYLLFRIVKDYKMHWKNICLMAICTVSMLGYSALMAIPIFVSIIIIMIILLGKRILPWQSVFPFAAALLLALPMIGIYAASNDVAESNIQIRIRTIGQIIEMIKKAPVVSMFRFFMEYGSISIITVICVCSAVVRKRMTFEKRILCIAIAVALALDILFYTGGPNDLGMATSFVGYLLLFVLAVSDDCIVLTKRRSVMYGILIFVFIGCWTNVKGIYPYRNLNVSLDQKQTNLMELSAWMCENTNCSESAIIFSDAVNNLNDFVPVLFHVKTFYPFQQGVQYLRGEEALEVYQYIQDYAKLSIKDKIDYFKKHKLNYMVVLPGSEEAGYFKNEKPVYDNEEFIVYKFDYAS